jgi:NAD(P)-dependent dehydrogenase (short-subunit alcohol dehydrogenase family)
MHAGCGKFALRGLSQSLAKEFQPAGVHIAHMIIDGVIGEPRSGRGRCGGETASSAGADPDAVAQSYWHVHAQDRSAWTQEMDIRSPSLM